jgi:hypothetical protein
MGPIGPMAPIGPMGTGQFFVAGAHPRGGILSEAPPQITPGFENSVRGAFSGSVRSGC